VHDIDPLILVTAIVVVVVSVQGSVHIIFGSLKVLVITNVMVLVPLVFHTTFVKGVVDVAGTAPEPKFQAKVYPAGTPVADTV
jgi:hypothetical protein